MLSAVRTPAATERLWLAILLVGPIDEWFPGKGSLRPRPSMRLGGRAGARRTPADVAVARAAESFVPDVCEARTELAEAAAGEEAVAAAAAVVAGADAGGGGGR